MVRWDAEWPEPGDYLRTPTGTTYLVHDVRPGRVRPFSCGVERLVAGAEPEPGRPVHPMVWVKR